MDIVLNCNEQLLSIIGAGLGELPYKVASPAIAEIGRQIREQQEQAAAPESETTEPPREE